MTDANFMQVATHMDECGHCHPEAYTPGDLPCKCKCHLTEAQRLAFEQDKFGNKGLLDNLHELSKVIEVANTPIETPAIKAEVMVGRPSDYTQELADRICELLSEGISLRTVCLDDDMPNKATVFRWLRTHKEFCDQYARAKEESADAMAEDILDIADDGTNDWMTRTNKNGDEYEVPNNEVLQRSRLRVDTRKWLMSKMKPKKYADKLDLTSGGEKLVNVASDPRAVELAKEYEQKLKSGL